jgi:hypothetical protein
MATFGKESVQFSWVHMVRKLQAYCWCCDYPLKHQPTTGETIFNSQTKMMIKIAQMARLPTPAGIYIQYRICKYMHVHACSASEHITVSYQIHFAVGEMHP